MNNQWHSQSRIRLLSKPLLLCTSCGRKSLAQTWRASAPPAHGWVVCRARRGVRRGWTTLLTVGPAQAGGTQQLTEQEWDVTAGGIGPAVLSVVFRPRRLTNLLISNEVTAQVGVQHLGM